MSRPVTRESRPHHHHHHHLQLYHPPIGQGYPPRTASSSGCGRPSHGGGGGGGGVWGGAQGALLMPMGGRVSTAPSSSTLQPQSASRPSSNARTSRSRADRHKGDLGEGLASTAVEQEAEGRASFSSFVYRSRAARSGTTVPPPPPPPSSSALPGASPDPTTTTAVPLSSSSHRSSHLSSSRPSSRPPPPQEADVGAGTSDERSGGFERVNSAVMAVDRDRHRRELDSVWRKYKLSAARVGELQEKLDAMIGDERAVRRTLFAFTEARARHDVHSAEQTAFALVLFAAMSAARAAAHATSEALRTAPRPPVRDSELLRALRRAEQRVAELEGEKACRRAPRFASSAYSTHSLGYTAKRPSNSSAVKRGGSAPRPDAGGSHASATAVAAASVVLPPETTPRGGGKGGNDDAASVDEEEIALPLAGLSNSPPRPWVHDEEEGGTGLWDSAARFVLPADPNTVRRVAVRNATIDELIATDSDAGPFRPFVIG